MPDYVFFNLKVTTYTPLHIGNGRTLLNLYDYAIRNGKTWRFNEDALLAAKEVDDLQQAELLARTPPEHLIDDEEYRVDNPIFRYVIQGTPKATGEGAELQEQIKDAQDRPYLPGSSLKGAIRTAIAWYAWHELGLHPEVHRLSNSPKWAASEYEAALFGPNPNHDLFRALQISDSDPVGKESLMLINVRVLVPGGKPGAPVEIEAIRPDVEFNMTLKYDRVLFSKWAKEHKLRLNGETWLNNFPEIARKFSLDHIQREIAWAHGIPGFDTYQGNYQKILSLAQKGGKYFLLQLGWGTGWEGKTFGSRLKENVAFMRTLLKPVRAGGYGVGRGRSPADVNRFPTSRRVVMSYQRDVQGNIIRETPAVPLGWAIVELSKKDEK